jgi:hypothetical protein
MPRIVHYRHMCVKRLIAICSLIDHNLCAGRFDETASNVTTGEPGGSANMLKALMPIQICVSGRIA